MKAALIMNVCCQTEFPNEFPTVVEIGALSLRAGSSCANCARSETAAVVSYEEPQTGAKGHFDIRYANFDSAQTVCLGGNGARAGSTMFVVAIGPPQASGTGGAVGSCDVNPRAEAVNAECCDESTEDCTSGVPLTCNPGGCPF